MTFLGPNEPWSDWEGSLGGPAVSSYWNSGPVSYFPDHSNTYTGSSPKYLIQPGPAHVSDFSYGPSFSMPPSRSASIVGSPTCSFYDDIRPKHTKMSSSWNLAAEIEGALDDPGVKNELRLQNVRTDAMYDDPHSSPGWTDYDGIATQTQSNYSLSRPSSIFLRDEPSPVPSDSYTTPFTLSLDGDFPGRSRHLIPRKPVPNRQVLTTSETQSYTNSTPAWSPPTAASFSGKDYAPAAAMTEPDSHLNLVHSPIDTSSGVLSNWTKPWQTFTNNVSGAWRQTVASSVWTGGRWRIF